LHSNNKPQTLIQDLGSGWQAEMSKAELCVGGATCETKFSRGVRVL